MAAAFIARTAPEKYKQIIERRHPGVRVAADPKSDIRSLKDEAAKLVEQAAGRLNLPLLAKIDDRHCWIFLIGSGDDEDDPERLVGELLDAGFRVNVALLGRRTKRIASKERLERLKQDKPLQITGIRAGLVWMQRRGVRQLGWHSAARIHFYDKAAGSKTYMARKADSLPPKIDKPDVNKSGRAGLSSPNSRLDKIRFPIDVVFTWVDGDDPEWNRKRAKRAREFADELHRVSNSQTRYTNRDELRYSLRSLYYFAPWVRHIFVVTDRQVPDWYDDSDPSLTIVHHDELFPDATSLPTFNSHAIESVLHRIPGLSEHFLYMNDDVFFSSVIQPESFFEVSGIARTFLSRAMVPFCDEFQSEIASEWGASNANALLYDAHQVMMPYKTKHTPIALRKSLLEQLERRYPEHFERIRNSPFRTPRDLAPTSSLHAYFGLAEGFVVRGSIAYRYVNLSRPDLKRALDSIAYSRHSMVYCLNDTEVDDHQEFDWDLQETLITDFLEMMYPYCAPWEVPPTDYSGDAEEGSEDE